jgi:energy-coupling factor transport system substrate-specific component
MKGRGLARPPENIMPSNFPTIILASACIALNVAAGTLVYLLKLPLYLDQAGIMLAAILVPGPRGKACLVSAIVAVVSFVVIGVLVSPFEPWFIGTGIASGLYGSLVVRGRVTDLVDGRATTRRFIGRLLLFGIGWGIVAAVVSAPIVVYLFGGVTGAGTTLIFAFLVKTGHQLLNQCCPPDRIHGRASRQDPLALIGNRNRAVYAPCIS